MQPKYVITVHTGGSMFGIPVTCQNPEAAMKYLNALPGLPLLQRRRSE